MSDALLFLQLAIENAPRWAVVVLAVMTALLGTTASILGVLAALDVRRRWR